MESTYDLKDTEVISSLTASVGFSAQYITADKMETLLYVLIQPQGGAIHYQTNGDAAATDEGIHLADGALVEIWGWSAIKNFRCIDNGGSAKLSCKYYGA